MLELMQIQCNDWEPPIITDEELNTICADGLPNGISSDEDFLIIMKVEPYIDAVYVHFTNSDSRNDMYRKRFVFHEDYRWKYEDERIFSERVLHNNRLGYTSVIDDIYRYYSKKYPDWKLKRYYTKPMYLLDHIYHCMRKGSAKEILYKAGLEELAAHIDDLEEIDLLSSKPSDIYGGTSMRALRSLNCRWGSLLLADSNKREFIKKLQAKYPETFKEPLNDAQCRYLDYLIEGDLTVGEAGRLFHARRVRLMTIWAPSQYNLFIWKESLNHSVIRQAEEIAQIDPIYERFVKCLHLEEDHEICTDFHILRNYLLNQRAEYDLRIKRSNRKRCSDWQERNKGYVVRYPQTINDFCREAIYMRNCLLAYAEAYVENDTTILFMREASNFNTPFITIEVFDNELKQAYHSFNEDCTAEEAGWILDYCDRHGIGYGNFRFDHTIDELM